MLLNKIPQGREIYEHPDGRVFLRKKLVSNILAEEIELCKNQIKQHCEFNEKAVTFDVKKNEIIVYFSEEIAYLPPMPDLSQKPIQNIDIIIAATYGSTDYYPMLKYVLEDKVNRLFHAERYCFLGGIDDWMFIGKMDTLENLVKRYAGHLGKESFFELY